MSRTSGLHSGLKAHLKRTLRQGRGAISGAAARIMTHTSRGPRFYGAFMTREAALAAMPEDRRAGYDDETIADVSFEQMCERMPWDYPIIFWLDRVLSGLPDPPSDDTAARPSVGQRDERVAVIDAGGHLGTKYIAFSDVLDLTRLTWTVHDLPGITRAAERAQAEGRIPAAISFEPEAASLPPADILLASGLLQYLDRPFAEFVAGLHKRPRYILLNKVALRDGPKTFTIERIGQGRVPYQIRDKTAWHQEINEMGYEIVDQWRIPGLGHVIATHPALGMSESRGYMLKLK